MLRRVLQGIKQEIQDVRLYFGQTVAYYFYFLGLYTRCLAYPALWGVVMPIDPRPTGCLPPLARRRAARVRRARAQHSPAQHGTSQYSKPSSLQVMFILGELNGVRHQYDRYIMPIVVPICYVIWTVFFLKVVARQACPPPHRTVWVRQHASAPVNHTRALANEWSKCACTCPRSALQRCVGCGTQGGEKISEWRSKRTGADSAIEVGRSCPVGRGRPLPCDNGHATLGGAECRSATSSCRTLRGRRTSLE